MPVYITLTSDENNHTVYVKADAILAIRVGTNFDKDGYTYLEMGAAYMDAIIVKETPTEVLAAIYRATLDQDTGKVPC